MTPGIVRACAALAAALALGASALRAQAPPHALPAFEDYHVADAFTGSPAPVKTAESKLARTYRTRLRDAESKGPNFAGHYTLVSWGCGSSCQEWAVIDARTGHVFDSMLQTTVGGEFRADSRLVLVDTPKLAAEMFGGPPPKDCAGCAGTVGAYEWRDDTWQPVSGFAATHVHRFK